MNSFYISIICFLRIRKTITLESITNQTLRANIFRDMAILLLASSVSGDKGSVHLFFIPVPYGADQWHLSLVTGKLQI